MSKSPDPARRPTPAAPHRDGGPTAPPTPTPEPSNTREPHGSLRDAENPSLQDRSSARSAWGTASASDADAQEQDGTAVTVRWGQDDTSGDNGWTTNDPAARSSWDMNGTPADEGRAVPDDDWNPDRPASGGWNSGGWNSGGWGTGGDDQGAWSRIPNGVADLARPASRRRNRSQSREPEDDGPIWRFEPSHRPPWSATADPPATPTATRDPQPRPSGSTDDPTPSGPTDHRDRTGHKADHRNRATNEWGHEADHRERVATDPGREADRREAATTESGHGAGQHVAVDPGYEADHRKRVAVDLGHNADRREGVAADPGAATDPPRHGSDRLGDEADSRVSDGSERLIDESGRPIDGRERRTVAPAPAPEPEHPGAAHDWGAWPDVPRRTTRPKRRLRERAPEAEWAIPEGGLGSGDDGVQANRWLDSGDDGMPSSWLASGDDGDVQEHGLASGDDGSTSRRRTRRNTRRTNASPRDSGDIFPARRERTRGAGGFFRDTNEPTPGASGFDGTNEPTQSVRGSTWQGGPSRSRPDNPGTHQADHSATDRSSKARSSMDRSSRGRTAASRGWTGAGRPADPFDSAGEPPEWARDQTAPNDNPTAPSHGHDETALTRDPLGSGSANPEGHEVHEADAGSANGRFVGEWLRGDSTDPDGDEGYVGSAGGGSGERRRSGGRRGSGGGRRGSARRRSSGWSDGSDEGSATWPGSAGNRESAGSGSTGNRESAESGSSGNRESGRSGPAANPESVARAICLRLLTMAPKTRAQLAEAMRKRDVPDEVAEAVLDRFTELGLINDEAFAEAWVDSRHHGRGLARRALAAELRHRGVDSETVNEAVERVDSDQEADTARRLVERKLASTRGLDPQARTRRLAGMLARKGYGAGLAYRVVREALENEGVEVEDEFP
ncbi:recombination regulator RecX [Nonomuraea africana]|uniref:recombination regulator RecX n=1 Tax=Nonomuraea africana TaxID=46171 RepID=UPI0033E16A5B